MVKAEGVSGSTVPRRSALELKPPSQHDVQAVQEPLPCYNSDFLGLHSRPVNLKSRQDRCHQRINAKPEEENHRANVLPEKSFASLQLIG